MCRLNEFYAFKFVIHNTKIIKKLILTFTFPCLTKCSVKSAPRSSSCTPILIVTTLLMDQSNVIVLRSPHVVKQTAAKVCTPNRYQPPPKIVSQLVMIIDLILINYL